MDWLAPVKAKGLKFLFSTHRDQWSFVGKEGTTEVEQRQLFNRDTKRFVDLATTLPKLAAGERYDDNARFTEDGRFLYFAIRQAPETAPKCPDIAWVDTLTGKSARFPTVTAQKDCLDSLSTPSGLVVLNPPKGNQLVVGNLDGKVAHRIPGELTQHTRLGISGGKTLLQFDEERLALYDFSRPTETALLGVADAHQYGGLLGPAAGGAALLFCKCVDGQNLYSLVSLKLQLLEQHATGPCKTVVLCDRGGSWLLESPDADSPAADSPTLRKEVRVFRLETALGIEGKGRFAPSDPKLAGDFLSADPAKVTRAVMTFRALGIEPDVVRQYVKSSFGPLSNGDRQAVAALPESLGQTDFAKREQATRVVQRLVIAAGLEDRLAIARKLDKGTRSADPETRARAKRLFPSVGSLLDPSDAFEARLRWLER